MPSTEGIFFVLIKIYIVLSASNLQQCKRYPKPPNLL